jgi:hypothetical protein
MRTWIALVIITVLWAPVSVSAGDTIVVGVDPELYEVTVAGTEGWNATGHVTFVVEASGCGTGDVTVCLVWWEPGWHLACNGCTPGMPRIDVDAYDLAVIEPADLCHELGHYLGLTYHRSDYLSCMSNPSATVNSPDDVDLANLGWVIPATTQDGSVVVTLPNTGAGPHTFANDGLSTGRLMVS